MSLGQDIRAAQCIYAILYGESAVWGEVNVMLWMREAEKITTQLKLNSFRRHLRS